MEISVSTNDINNYSISELNYIRESSENMNKFNQIEVLRILHNNKDVTLNENKYGVHVNISELKKEISLIEKKEENNRKEKKTQDQERKEKKRGKIKITGVAQSRATRRRRARRLARGVHGVPLPNG